MHDRLASVNYYHQGFAYIDAEKGVISAFLWKNGGRKWQRKQDREKDKSKNNLFLYRGHANQIQRRYYK